MLCGQQKVCYRGKGAPGAGHGVWAAGAGEERGPLRHPGPGVGDQGGNMLSLQRGSCVGQRLEHTEVGIAFGHLEAWAEQRVRGWGGTWRWEPQRVSLGGAVAGEGCGDVGRGHWSVGRWRA